MKTYIYRNELVPVIRQDGFSAEDQKIMSKHFEYLKSYMEAGKLLLAGPCEDRAFGIAIFYAESDAEARAFMNNDPAIRDGLMTAEVHPFRLSLFRCD